MAVAIQAREPVLALGAPGIGKTTMMQSVAKSLDMHMETVIASLREPSDFGGLPIINGNTVSLAIPDWAQALIDAKGGIAFFDELTTAPPAVQGACLRVIHESVVGRTHVPNVSYVAAANPPEQAAGGWELAAPLANRFCHINWSVDQQGWIDGMLQGFPAPTFPRLSPNWQALFTETRAQVAGFIRSKPQLLLVVPQNDAAAGKPWPSPRSWDMAARLMAANKAASAGPDSETMLVAGCVGEGVGIEFLNWRNALDLPDPETLLKNPEKFEMPERGDRSFTILASVAAAVAQNVTKQRYLAAWTIFRIAAKKGQKDVAAASVRALAKAGQGKGFLQDKDVREAQKENLLPFLEILKTAGLI